MASQPELEGAVRDLLLSRTYPGNVRDLRSLVLRIIPRYLGAGVVTVGDIPDNEHRPAAPGWSSTGPAGAAEDAGPLAGGAPPGPRVGVPGARDGRPAGHSDQRPYAPADAESPRP